MKARYTLLAASLMMAIGTVSAANNMHEIIPSDVYKIEITGNGSLIGRNPLNGKYWVTGGSNDLTGASLVQVTGVGSNKIFNGQVWVDGAVRLNTLMATKETTVTNEGRIYINGNFKVKALSAEQGGKAINGKNGEIVIVGNGDLFGGASAFQGTNSSTRKDTTFENHGVIRVYGNGNAFKLDSNAVAPASVVNTGRIFVNDENAIGLNISRGNNGTQNVNFENIGKIVAHEGKAISVSATNAEQVTLIFKDTSIIDGIVDLNDTTDLLFSGNTNDGIALQLKDGAKSIKLENSDITIEQAIVNDKTSTLTIDTLTVNEGSSLDFVLNNVEAGKQQLVVTDMGESVATVSYSGLVGDMVFEKPELAKDLITGVQLGIGEDKNPDEVTVAAGEWSDEIVVKNNGADEAPTIVTTSENTLLRSARDLAILNATIWRSELSTLSDRMGTLRSAPEATGAWARYNGGSFNGETIEHDYHGVEVGFDKAISANTTLGMSFGYTMGQSDIVAGEADTNSYKLGFYASHYNEVGSFVDTMFKFGRVNVDYDARLGDKTESGEYNYTGMIFGVEGGHRWSMNQFFVEPTVQLSYSHLRAEDYNTNVRDVRFDTMQSLIARAAVTTGWNFAENGSAYARVAYNHDFMGDVEGNFSNARYARSYKDELDDNWGDFAIGADYRVNKDINTFVDVSRSFGGDIDQEWRVNLGARYTF